MTDETKNKPVTPSPSSTANDDVEIIIVSRVRTPQKGEPYRMVTTRDGDGKMIHPPRTLPESIKPKRGKGKAMVLPRSVFEELEV